MDMVFFGFVANQLAASVACFVSVWLVMRRRSDLSLSAWWLAPGVLASALICGAIRFLVWMLSGEDAGASIDDVSLVFYFFFLPISVAIALCRFLAAQK